MFRGQVLGILHGIIIKGSVCGVCGVCGVGALCVVGTGTGAASYKKAQYSLMEMGVFSVFLKTSSHSI